MEQTVQYIALALGLIALIGAIGAAYESISRSWWRRKAGDHLQVKIDGKRFVIDLSALDTEDAEVTIKKATMAVKEARRTAGVARETA